MRSTEGLGSSFEGPELSLHEHRACEWVGVAEDDERVAYCGRAAQGAVIDHFGVSHYACLEHLSEMKGRFGTGKLRLFPGSASARPFPEAIP